MKPAIVLVLCGAILGGLALIYQPPPRPDRGVDTANTVNWQLLAERQGKEIAQLRADDAKDSAAAVIAGRRAAREKARADSMNAWILAFRSDTGATVINPPNDTTLYEYVILNGVDSFPHGVPSFILNGARQLQVALTAAVNKQIADSVYIAGLRRTALTYWRGSLQRDSVIRVRDDRILELHTKYTRRERGRTIKAAVVGAAGGFLLKELLDAFR